MPEAAWAVTDPPVSWMSRGSVVVPIASPATSAMPLASILRLLNELPLRIEPLAVRLTMPVWEKAVTRFRSPPGSVM